MAGVKIELNGKTKEELKKQLNEVILEVDKAPDKPGQKTDLHNEQALWKVSYDTS